MKIEYNSSDPIDNVIDESDDVLDSIRGKSVQDNTLIEESGSQINKEYQDEIPENGFQCLDCFSDPAMMLAIIDSNIASQKIKLYKWQVEKLEKFGRIKPTGKKPYKEAICAANGSGKDKFITSPTSIWFIVSKIRSIVVITSSSGVQLTTQTERYIRDWAIKMNQWSLANIGKEIIKIRQRRITCTLSGSEIFLFATDEKAKAEGYHPTDVDTEMMIIVNEAKSVKPGIYEALNKCTGFNYWLDISTPGEPLGDFHYHFMNWPNKSRITYYDCPHQSPDEFEEDKKKYGEHSPEFRSKWLALFTFVGGSYVISNEKLEQLRTSIRQGFVKELFQNEDLSVGLDIALSGNGDETVITSFKGNKQIHLITMRNGDSITLAQMINNAFLNQLHLKKDHKFIYADDGGVGRAVISILNRMGWININRVLNNSKAKTKEYRNRGAEIWYKAKRLIEEQVLILKDDNKLYEQIASRKFLESKAGIDKLTLQSKKAMLSEGFPSPDRADATMLALCKYNVLKYLNELEKKKPIIAPIQLDQSEYIYELERKLMAMSSNPAGKGKRIHNSINALMQTDNREQKLSKYM